MGMVERIQQNNTLPQPEQAVSPVLQQPPPPVLALQPQVLLTPLALPTAVARKPAQEKPARPPLGVHPGGKAPRAMADIRAYQRAHRHPTFSESESDEEKRNESEPNKHERQISFNRMQAAGAPKQTNAANKRKFQLVVYDSSSDASASAVDSAMERRKNDLREPATGV